jgi:hypothetical protein
MRRFIYTGLCCLSLLACLAPLPAWSGQAVPQAAIRYAPDNSEFANPERGFYHQVDCSSGPLDPKRLRRYRAMQHDSLVMCAFLLTEALDAPISEDKLALLQRQFDLVRAAGLKMVLRFAYNYSDNGVDAVPARTLFHLEQLQPLLVNNRDVLAVLQAGFVGSWGEWGKSLHYGGGDPSPENWNDRKALMAKLLQVVPAQRMIQLRTPELKYRLIGHRPLTSADAYEDMPAARVGHHNDCFLASDNDWGTYRMFSPATPAWLAADSAHVAVGGETCNLNPPRSECASALAEMARFHWSYLNGDFHEGVLASWRTGGCQDDIRRRLGYRLVLQHGIYQHEAKPGGTLRIVFTLNNEGFAAPFNPRAAELVLRNASGVHRIPLAADPRQWQPQRTYTISETVTLPAKMAKGDYELLLHLPDPEPALRERPEYAIRLANAGIWEEKTGFNRLNDKVRVGGK